ncbi:MAG: glycoside hydrolase family 2 TIM barrel-domain containing protein [Eubacteriales bacterium]|nr:glycoside hydrolase family 2 TIM barrel-domain containing protein [Eubacteriales bacterium]
MRQTVSFCDDWLFHQGDIQVEVPLLKTALYLEAKAERRRCGPAARGYLDSPNAYNDQGLITHETWNTVTLPHDYIITQEPKPDNNDTLGFFHYENAWYRKHFSLDAALEGKKIRLYFEGAGVHATVYVNGCYLYTNRCGYNSFEVDISDVVTFDQENVVAVFIDASSEHEGWWYEGAGIYRPVWLEICDAVSVDRYGVYVHPEKQANGAWYVPVDTTLRNDSKSVVNAEVETRLISPDGAVIASATATQEIPAYDHATLKQGFSVEAPALWDVDSPVLYTTETKVLLDGEPVDQQKNRFGFRTIRYDASEGFFLNDRHVIIKGVCCHQDYGLTGKAVPERVQRYRLTLLKEMGANGYRTSHYPQHAYSMDCMDELGFLVMDETRWFETTPEGLAQLEMLIKRDRNHPSVVLWSVGNEEPLHITDAGRRITERMTAEVHRWDRTRPVTTAVSHSPSIAKAMEAVEVIGVNYNIESFDGLHEKYPDKPFVSTENCATGTTRGWYRADCPSRGFIYGYDRDTNKSFLSRERTWKYFMERPWVAGGYQWAGIEHRGETVWPRLCSQSGALDLFLQKKDAFYQNQSLWTEKPMLHLMPHWNWNGFEGEEILVRAYTNCDRVELFLNGVSQGVRQIERYGHADWQVAYQPGRLTAKGWKNGALVCEEAVETTGAPVALRLTLNTPGTKADGKDVAVLTCDCVDSEGRHVPTASPMVHFNANGLGQVTGTGSSVCDHNPVTCPDRRMYAGLVAVLVRAGTTAGKLKVYAEAEGLRSAMVEIILA